MGKTLSLLGAPAMRALLLLFLYSGLSNGFWSGVLTQQLRTDAIGPAMVIVGVAEVPGPALASSLCAAAHPLHTTFRRSGRGGFLLRVVSLAQTRL